MCCGSEKLSKIGEDVTETLAVIPRQWKVIQTVCEKFTCRHCEKISQPPALFHPTPRGWRECLRPVARLGAGTREAASTDTTSASEAEPTVGTETGSSSC